MRTAHDYSKFEKVIVRNFVQSCLRCGKPLSFSYRGMRHVVFLNGKAQQVHYDVKYCGSPGCRAYFPEFIRMQTIPNHQYSLQVIARIGLLRLKQTLTFEQIGEDLRRNHGIQISDREVEYLFGVYQAIVSTPIEKDAKRLEALRQQGRMILSLDAAQPEMDGEALWIFRDEISGEVLRGFSAASIDAAGLAQEIGKVKALGVPIRGVISDGQNIILKAVQEELPGVAHQLCQLHYLKDLAKPVNQADRELKGELQQKLKGLRSFERAAELVKGAAEAQEKEIKAPPTVAREQQEGEAAGGPGRPATRAILQRPIDEEESMLVKEVCELIRAILKTHGRYPLEAPGVKACEKLQELLAVLQEELPKKREVDYWGN